MKEVATIVVVDTAKKSALWIGCGKQQQEPDSAWNWFVCIIGLISGIVILGFLFSFGVLNPVFLEEFQQGKARTGKLLLAYEYSPRISLPVLRNVASTILFMP